MRYTTINKLLLFAIVLMDLISCNKATEDIETAREQPVIQTIIPSSGTYESIVTIVGKNFALQINSNKVRFNGSLATVLRSTGDSLIVKAPAQFTTGPVSVQWGNEVIEGPVFELFEGEVITIAGTGEIGYEDGPGASARFNYPNCLALDSDGNVYVSDGTPAIRKIDKGGLVSTIAGSDESGYLDASALDARFFMIRGLAFNTNGELLISSNRCIRKLDKNGYVSRIIGTPPEVNPEDNSLNAADNIICDAANNLYLSRYDGIVKINAGGTSSHFVAGPYSDGFADGPGNQAKFRGITSLAITPTGEFLVGDYLNDRIRKIDNNGNVTTFAGNHDNGYFNGPAAKAIFARPMVLTLDANGTLYVAEESNHAIRTVRDGYVARLAGNMEQGFKDGPLKEARFSYISAIAIDKDGNLYVADSGNQRIRKVILHK